MKKLFTLLILLGLLPVTALAAGEDAPNVLCVGTTNIGTTSYNDNAAYWTSEDGGTTWNSQQTQPEGDSYIYYDGQGTLELHNVTIQGQYDDSNVFGAGIYALCGTNQSVSLTIQLTGNNTITGDFGIYVEAQQGGTLGANASLSITGDGSLTVTGTASYGLYVKSGTGNASLTIENASVDAKTTQTYSSYAGVCVQSGASATDSPNISLSVDGGSLTASASEGNDGIQFYVGNSSASATTSLTVSENAIVDARNGGISASGISETLPTPKPTGENSSGIVFDGSTGTVYGTVALQNELTIGEGESLTVPEGSSLNCNEKLTNNGAILASGGTVTGSLSGGTAVTTPNITVQPSDNTVTEGQGATFTVATDSDNASYQWQQSADSGSTWKNIDSSTSDSYTINSTTTDMNNYQYRCVVTSVSGVSVISSAAILTVEKKTTYTISAVVAPTDAGSVTVNGSGTSATVEAGKEVTLSATANSGYRFVEWMENDARVSTDAIYTFEATSNRTLTAQFEKVYTVTVSSTEGGTATGGGTYAEGETVTLTATPNSGYHFVDWKVASGTVTIQDNQFTMPAENMEVQAVFGLSVTSVTLNKTELILYIDDSETLTATIEPSEAAGQTVTWESNKETIATVDANGKVTAVAIGEATITATAGGITATCVVKVRDEVKVEASGSTNLSFTTDQDEFTLTATVQVNGDFLNPTDGSWTWNVADVDVVALSGSPTWRSQSYSISRQAFTIKGTGTTTITATYDDGTYRGSVDFKVRISKPTPPDPISYYNIYVEDVCDGVEVSTSKQVVREGGSINVYVEKDTARYTFDNFKVYYKRSYYGTWDELKEGTQPGEYPIKNIWTHIYIKAEGAEEKEDPTGIESIEGVKVYTKDGSLYVQTPQREQVIIVSMTGAVVKNEEQVGLKQYHGLQPGIYVVRIGEKAYKLRLH